MSKSPGSASGPAYERARRRIAGALLGGIAEPKRLGRFAVLRLVGQGGMGKVYAAFDEQLDRRVALKVIAPSKASSPEARQRMVREAKAMARLSHPNVVAVYEAGEQDDTTFLVLEFIDGPTLDAWLAEEERSAQEILDAFAAIGAGLVAAHDAGVVHRDFKPANVLFSRGGTPKVADFGLAATSGQPDALESTDEIPIARGEGRLTTTGYAVGTPMFMSPEQWSGEAADARSDQFSFCVALYKALYGRDAFEGSTPEARRDAVLDGAPREPASATAVPPWLWAPIKRGLARAPDARFEDMRQLLGALQADPRARRRRLGLLGAGALVVIGVGASFPIRAEISARACATEAAAIDDIWNADRRAQMETAFAGLSAGHAVESWTKAAREIETYAADWSDARLDACVASTVEHRVDGVLAGRASECLEEELERFQFNVDFLSDPNPSVVDQAASLFGRVQEPKDCNDENKLAVRPDLPSGPAERARAREIRKAIREVSTLNWRGDDARALVLAKETLVDALDLGWPPLVTTAHSSIGDVYSTQWNGEPAAQAYREAYDVAASAGHDELALKAIVGLMFALTEMLGRPDEALWWHGIAQPTVARAGLQNSGDMAQLWRGYGAAQQALGDNRSALDAYTRAHALFEERFGAGATATAAALGDIGVAHLELGEYEAALQAFEAAHATEVLARGGSHPHTATSLTNIGVVYAEQGRGKDAEASYRAALEILERAYGRADVRVATLNNNIGGLLNERGEFEVAEQSIRLALVSRLQLLDPKHPHVASSYYNLGEALEGQGRRNEAIAAFSSALEIYEARDPEGEDAIDARAVLEALADVDADVP